MSKKLLFLLCLLPTTLFASKLDKLESLLRKDLKYLNLPPVCWRTHDEACLDVAIIGGGMLGTAVGFALKLEGIYNVEVFEAAPEGRAGQWLNTARMKTLRSGKTLQGPALGLPHLTFRAWYQKQNGKKAWKKLGKIPTYMWGKYLQWVQSVLKIPVTHNAKVEHIVPLSDNSLLLIFADGSEKRAKKVVLATGRAGFGGGEIPEFVQNVPKQYWAHTSEQVGPNDLKNKRVVVIGVGASAFDAAGFSLENKAKSVDMLMRRNQLPKDNYFANFGHCGFKNGYFYLDDQKRVDLFTEAYSNGIPPPVESIERASSHKNFRLRPNTGVHEIYESSGALAIVTNQGTINADFLFLGTGFTINGALQSELSYFHDKILLWQDRLDSLSPKLGRFPYLGPSFEFREKYPGEAPYLKHIHCFNYGAFLSHGRISGDIDCIDLGIKRLAQGIATGLFLKDMNEGVSHDMPADPNTCQGGLDGGVCPFTGLIK